MGSAGSLIPRGWQSRGADTQQPGTHTGPAAVPAHHKRKRKRKQRKRSRSSTAPQSQSRRRPPDQKESWQQGVRPDHGKKVKIASEQAYQTLFLNGETSDIKIRALGKVWCLHKTFLCQSSYFANVFRGSWKESHRDIIDLEIHDQNIDALSLHFVLGSLYRDGCVLREPLRVPGVLATACLLQVEDLIRQCEETMKGTTDAKTVCGYYAAAETYGLDSVKTGCFEWLLHNLMTHPSVTLYKELSTDLMSLLVSSSNLLVLENEIDVYTTLKQWMFLRLNPAWTGSIRQLSANANDWLSRQTEGVGNTAFLETERGLAFQPVFKKLRLQHIICDLASTRVIEQDALVPPQWLSYVYKQQWFTLLRAQQCRVIGPRCINQTELEEHGMRCGKMIAKDGEYSWKWSGYNFSFPLHVIFTRHYIIFKRFIWPRDGSVSLQPIRNVAFRLTLVYFDPSGKIRFSKTTGYKILTFQNDEEQMVMNLNSTSLIFPLYVFCNFLFMSSENPGN